MTDTVWTSNLMTFRHSHSNLMVLSQHGHVLFYRQSLLALAQGELSARAAQCLVWWWPHRHHGIVISRENEQRRVLSRLP